MLCYRRWRRVVYLSLPTSNHNRNPCRTYYRQVVYLSLPTSNHNSLLRCTSRSRLYIFRFLHQTTTDGERVQIDISCISFASYIKPQLVEIKPTKDFGCISFASYIKPQLVILRRFLSMVVYLSLPTSNHNPLSADTAKSELYIFRFLHQTTTAPPQLQSACGCISFASYIKPQPCGHILPVWYGCISFASYIKPQLSHAHRVELYVVYLSLPTSNHNLTYERTPCLSLYIFRFLHQTTTTSGRCCFTLVLYIFRFLHQTTTY